MFFLSHTKLQNIREIKSKKKLSKLTFISFFFLSVMYCLLLLLLEIYFNLSGVIFVYRKSGGIDKKAVGGVEEVTSLGGWGCGGGGGGENQGLHDGNSNRGKQRFI